MMEIETFLMKPNHQCYLSQWGQWVYGAQSWKQGRLLCESMFVPINKWTLTLLNDGKRSFSYETKASMSFILMRTMSLWWPIVKRKEIIMCTHFCPSWPMNFNSKNWWKEKPFLCNKTINVIYPNAGYEFMVPNHEQKGVCESMFVPIDKWL